MDRNINPTISIRFAFLANCSDDVLKLVVDAYNRGSLSPETCVALEAMEAMIDEEERAHKNKEFRESMMAYLDLYDAGFRITNSKLGEFGRCEINRFWWNGKVIRSMPDIDKIQGEWDAIHYNTIANGHVEPLI